jgi:MSHA biogenesis protein MshP
MSTTCPERRASGFAIVSAIFILVVLAALAGFIVSVTSTQALTFAQDIQGARAYQAARAGTEWGIASWLAVTPDCAIGDTPITLSGDLSAFTVTVRRTPFPNPPVSGGVNFCEIISTAYAGGDVGSLGYVERQVQVVVEGN